jgi:hypothetical protein
MDKFASYIVGRYPGALQMRTGKRLRHCRLLARERDDGMGLRDRGRVPVVRGIVLEGCV